MSQNLNAHAVVHKVLVWQLDTLLRSAKEHITVVLYSFKQKTQQERKGKQLTKLSITLT